MTVLLPNRPQVLIVDDVADNVELLGAALDDFCDIRFALSGPEGLKMVEEAMPDLILLDVMMPDMDGYEVCDLLKHEPRTRQIPVIFVTAKTDAESETRALAGGGVDFIHKPINRDVVRTRVRMQLALRASLEENLKSRRELEQQIAERTHTLRDALQEAEAANRAKSNFLSNMSHELRTPLNAVLGFAALLQRKLTDPALRQCSEHIRDAGLRLLSVLNNMLDMARLEADKFAIEAIDFNLLTMLNLCEAQIQQEAQRKELILTREIDPALPLLLHADPLRIAQILSNLLNNAVKFSERGCITLRARQRGATPHGLTVRFEVEDQGIGVPPAQQERIFNTFEQSDNSSTRQFGGCGLGLAICKHLVHLMAGRIGLISPPGGGSLFWIELPLSLATDSDGAPEPADVANNAALLSKTLAHLAHLLAEDNLTARTLWLQHRDLLQHFMGEQAQAFETAMEKHNLAQALVLLQAAMAHPPHQIPGDCAP